MMQYPQGGYDKRMTVPRGLPLEIIVAPLELCDDYFYWFLCWFSMFVLDSPNLRKRDDFGSRWRKSKIVAATGAATGAASAAGG